MKDLISRNNNNFDLWDPFSDFFDIPRPRHDREFNNLMRTDIKENDNGYELEVDLPGFKKEDIHVNIDDHYLTVSAQRHTEAEQKDKKGNYVRCERSYGSFERSFDIRGVEADKISGCYKDGVLQLTMPKKAGKTSSSREIDIQ